jgi:hypothetical protein
VTLSHIPEDSANERICRAQFNQFTNYTQESNVEFQPTNAVGYGNGIGGLSVNAGTTMLPLDNLARSLEGAIERILKNTAQARAVGDSLFGGTADKAQMASGSVAPAAPGRINSLTDQAATLHRYIDELEQQLARLNAVIG